MRDTMLKRCDGELTKRPDQYTPTPPQVTQSKCDSNRQASTDEGKKDSSYYSHREYLVHILTNVVSARFLHLNGGTCRNVPNASCKIFAVFLVNINCKHRMIIPDVRAILSEWAKQSRQNRWRGGGRKKGIQNEFVSLVPFIRIRKQNVLR